MQFIFILTFSLGFYGVGCKRQEFIYRYLISAPSSLSLLCTFRQIVLCGDYQPASVCRGIIPHEPQHKKAGRYAVKDLTYEQGQICVGRHLPPCRSLGIILK